MRYIKECEGKDIKMVPNYNVRQVFSPNEEEMLAGYFIKCALLHHGPPPMSIFSDDEFLPAEFTDQRQPEPQRQPQPEPQLGCIHEDHNIPEDVTLEQTYPGHLTPQPENVTSKHSPRDVNDSILTPSMIQLFPKSSSNNSTEEKRKCLSTTIITNSNYETDRNRI
ncbi:hypothetical protein HHI36_019843 [Cryptolaemus montrouzieri]|uniref:NAC domain-containing protein n=1 Tax=Cryptolaemus montrouzieri TaxID=559131 RepID=A0ABD2N8F1_9CUCU